MKIIVDTNVVFSAILSPSGKIGQILIYGRKQFEFYAPNLVKIEVKRHRDKREGEIGNNVDNVIVVNNILTLTRYIKYMSVSLCNPAASPRRLYAEFVCEPGRSKSSRLVSLSSIYFVFYFILLLQVKICVCHTSNKRSLN